MPALVNYTHDGTHGVFMCKDGEQQNVPIDIANQYAVDGWSQDCPTVPVSPLPPTTLPHVGATFDLFVIMFFFVVGYLIVKALKR